MTQQVIADLRTLGAGFALDAEQAEARAALVDVMIEALEGGDVSPRLGNYSQRDLLWRNEIFAGGLRFETDGCYVCAYADIVALAGYSDDPGDVARILRTNGCFNGANLSYPERGVVGYPHLCYDGTHQWHHGPADMDLIWRELDKSPIIAEVDFQWKTQTQNQHFVVLVSPTVDQEDIWIHDPWDGSRVRLLQKYAAEHWDLARTIYGLRLLRVRGM